MIFLPVFNKLFYKHTKTNQLIFKLMYKRNGSKLIKYLKLILIRLLNIINL